ncbi:putative 2OG-Fe(II) oxygenase family oxidoreductase [Xylogone sp. PMI_703]|nr:putative 2OG-Fe(II) oxygenase family oxidoreductase [Xylogone sp. PMI_703]
MVFKIVRSTFWRRPPMTLSNKSVARRAFHLSPTRAAGSVPTIDIGPFLTSPSSPESQAIISQVAEACQNTGFFQIINHGITPFLQQATFAAARRFFALPFDAKSPLDAKNNVGMRGYDVLASQSYDAGLLPDLKEGYYTGIDVPPNDPAVLARRFFQGPNVWPDPKLLAPHEFREPAEAYHRAMISLSRTIMQIIGRTLNYGPRVFEVFDAFVQNPVSPLRFLHYPPGRALGATGGDVKPQFGSSPHTDFGAITLLLQDEHEGLQVQDDEGNWISVPPRPDAYVVNVGDMLSMWTGYRYKSSVHRVINEGGTDRYSIVFFLDGNLDCPLSPLDGSPPEGGKSITVEDHMLKRITESYAKK